MLRQPAYLLWSFNVWLYARLYDWGYIYSLAISHAVNIKVYYPDENTTEGLAPQHIDMLKPMFVFAPGTKI